MSGDAVLIVATVIVAALVVLLGLGGLNVVLWRDVRAEIRSLSSRLDALCERLVRIERRLGGPNSNSV